jgi:hypothetical protein
MRENHFSILHGSSFTERIKKQVIEAFYLPMEKVEDEWDEHYDPLPKDFIF